MAFRPLRRLGCFGGLVLGMVLVFALTAVLTPWAYHVGGRWTPGVWWGFGKLRTEAGNEYPLFIYFFPNFRSMSRLRLNEQRPVSGLTGMAWLCSAQGVTQRLDLSGDLYGSHLDTDGDQMRISLLDARGFFQINPRHRPALNLTGSWHGPELAMQDGGSWERGFLRKPHNPPEKVAVTFTWGSYADFKNLCNATAIPEKAQIPPPSN